MWYILKLIYIIMICYSYFNFELFNNVEDRIKLIIFGLIVMLSIIFYIMPMLKITKRFKVSDFFERIMLSLTHDWDKIFSFHIVSFVIFFITIIVLALGLDSVVEKIAHTSNNSGVLTITFLAAICIYHYWICDLIRNKLLKTKWLNDISDNKFLTKITYLYMIFVYIIYKFSEFNGVSVDEFKMPIEAIVIFFMIDVYVDKINQKH